jgi:NADPH-dependent 2,4-dienoyl-CoA reductase/sulfur reductase-like enzyme
MSLLVGVIGAGPVGLAAARQAIDLRCKVELIDPWVMSQKSSLDKRVGKKKTRFGSADMYDYPKKFIEAPLFDDVPISSVVGGLSTVWGAGLDFNYDKINSDYSEMDMRESEKLVRSIF